MRVPLPQRERIAETPGFDDRLRGAIVTRTARAPAEIEPERLVGAAGQPAFLSGWFNLSALTGQFGPARFWRTSDGWVHVAGVVARAHYTGGPSLPVFTLPPGYRPPYEQQAHYFTQVWGLAPFTSMAADMTGIGTTVEGTSVVTVVAEGRAGAGLLYAPTLTIGIVCASLDGIKFRAT